MSLTTLDDLLAELKKHKVTGANCKDIRQLARVMQGYQQIVEAINNEIRTEIINIINNGGGGATTPVYVVRALVAQVGGVPANQETFPFDNSTTLYKPEGADNAPAAGTARNVGLRAFQDNEIVKLVSFNGTTFLADKVTENIIAARVNEPGDVLTTDNVFEFDGAVAIGTSPLPPGAAGWAINSTGNAYANNEVVVLQLVENPATVAAYLPFVPGGVTQLWAVLQDDDDLGGGGGGGGDGDTFISEARHALVVSEITRAEFSRVGNTTHVTYGEGWVVPYYIEGEQTSPSLTATAVIQDLPLEDYAIRCFNMVTEPIPVGANIQYKILNLAVDGQFPVPFVDVENCR